MQTRGSSALGLPELSQAACMKAASLYSHFESRALFDAALDHGICLEFSQQAATSRQRARVARSRTICFLICALRQGLYRL